MLKSQAIIAASFAVMFSAAAAGFAWSQQGVGEKLGRKLDEVGQGIKGGAVEVGDAVRRKFDGVKTEVRRMETHNRVYARIHWDKAFNKSGIEVHQLKGGAILLRGLVPDAAAKKKAMDLAIETVGVTEVIDELAIPLKPTSKAAPKPHDEPPK